MATNIEPQASQTLSCPLLNLPPELRLLIYAYTHRLPLDTAINGSGCENFSKVWESTPLVKLAATCRLIANEARHYVRTLPESRRVVDVELLGQRGGFGHLSPCPSYVSIRLRHLPCPTVDLRQFAIKYDVRKHKITQYGFTVDAGDDAARATRDMGNFVFSALRRLMTDVSLSNAAKLKFFIFQIVGIPRREDTESDVEAVQRVLSMSEAGPASAEKLVQEIFWWAGVHADLKRGRDGTWLAFFEGRPLCLVMGRE